MGAQTATRREGFSAPCELVARTARLRLHLDADSPMPNWLGRGEWCDDHGSFVDLRQTRPCAQWRRGEVRYHPASAPRLQHSRILRGRLTAQDSLHTDALTEVGRPFLYTALADAHSSEQLACPDGSEGASGYGRAEMVS